jgi:hypothetical protein
MPSTFSYKYHIYLSISSYRRHWLIIIVQHINIYVVFLVQAPNWAGYYYHWDDLNKQASIQVQKFNKDISTWHLLQLMPRKSRTMSFKTKNTLKLSTDNSQGCKFDLHSPSLPPCCVLQLSREILCSSFGYKWTQPVQLQYMGSHPYPPTTWRPTSRSSNWPTWGVTTRLLDGISLQRMTSHQDHKEGLTYNTTKTEGVDTYHRRLYILKTIHQEGQLNNYTKSMLIDSIAINIDLFVNLIGWHL